LTEQLARLLVFGASEGFGVPWRLEGLAIKLGTDQLVVTPNCLGLIAMTAYLAGLLAVPSDWVTRWRGVRRDLPLLVLANVLRLILLFTLAMISVSALRISHVLILVAVAPLAVMGLWGLWLTRDVNALPRYPWRFLGLVTLAFLPSLGVWWVLLDPYLSALVVATRSILIGLLGTPIESSVLVREGVTRFLSLTLPEGDLRLEVAARSLSLVPYLALCVASPLPWVRRLWLGMLGVVTLFVIHTAESTSLIVLGRTAPALVPPAEALSDFLTVATGPLMWFLLAAPSQAWWAPPKGTRRRGPGRRS